MPSPSSIVTSQHSIVPPELYAYLELAEDAELNRIVDERVKRSEFVSVNLEDL
jgi:antitoxin StbD